MAFGADRSVKVNLDLTIKGYLANLAVAKKSTSDFARDAQASAKKHREDWDRVGKSLLGVGAAAAVGVGLAVKTFADFDQAMSAAAVGTNATTLELKSLREAAIKAGADTMYSATEAAQAITEMGKAGVSTQDILSGGLKGALDLAAAGQLEVGRAGEIAAVAMNQFGLAGKDIPHIADVLAAGAGKAMGSVQDLGTAFEQVAPVAASMGWSLEETTGVLAEFAQAGLKGEKGGTSLRSAMLSLTAPSKIAKKAMDDLGISMYDAQGKTLHAAEMAEQLHNVLGGLDDATRNQAMGQIFGNEAMAGATVLYKGGASAVVDWTKKVYDAGYATRAAAKLTDNLKGDIERLGGSIDTVLIKGSSGANGPLRGLVQGLEDVVNGFGNLGPAGSQAAFGLAAATAGIALLAGGATLAVPKIVMMRASLKELEVTSVRTAAALKLAGTAFALFAVAEGANILGSYIGQSQVATVETDKLAASLGNLNSAAGSADFRSIFQQAGPLAKDIKTADDALKSFGVSAYNALDQGWDARIRRMQDFGGAQAKFAKQTGQIDTALAQMVRSGNAGGAARALEELTDAARKQGVPVSVVRKQFKEYDAALAEAGAAAVAAGGKIDPLTGKVEQVAAVTSDAIGNTNSLGSALLLMGKDAKAADEAVKDLAKSIQSDMDAASKAFATDMDVLGKYDPKSAADKSKAAQEAVTAAEQAAQDTRERIAAKKKRTVSDTQALEKANDRVDKARAVAQKAKAEEGAAGLEASYKASIAAAKTFTKDIAEVTRRGLDPQVVAKLLQEGPEKAAPALEALLGKNSARMIGMVNSSEAALAKINQSVVEQARLTSMAVNSSTDTMVADLDRGMAIAQVKAAHGGKATAEALAKELHLGVAEVKRIATEFGIAIDSAPRPKPIPVTVNTAQGRAAIADIRQQLANLDGTVAHTYVSTSIANEHDRRQDAANSTGTKPAWDGSQPDPFHRAGGGPVWGAGTSTSDSIPAYLSNGEYVVKAAAVAKYGTTLFDHLNNMRFASGGFVGSAQPVMATHTETHSAPVNIENLHGVSLEDVERQAESRRRLEALGRRRSR